VCRWFHGPYMGFIYGQKDIVKQLLEKGAARDLQTADGSTALIWASIKSRTDAINLLMDMGANSDLKRNDGASALIIAVQHG